MSHSDTASTADQTFAAIEAAFAETARGRWFLAEFARRNRAADTQVLLDAMARLEAAVSGRAVLADLEQLRADLADMTGAIARTKAEVAALATEHGGAETLGKASATLDGIVRTTERATSDILDATEKIQEIAWTMREGGFDPTLCDALDGRATETYAACEFQDLTAQRVDRVVRILGYLENRIAAMNRIWGVPADIGELEQAPPRLTQTDIDFVIVHGESDPAATVGASSAPAVLPHRPPSKPSVRARLDALGTRDTLQLFT